MSNERRQVEAVHVLHHQEGPAVCFVGVVGDHDIRVREPRGGLDLLLEAPQRIGRPHEFGRQRFQGHDPVHAAMDGFEYVPHAAMPQAVQDHIVAQDERIVSALTQRLGLIRRQFAQLHQPPRQVQPARRPLLVGQSRQALLYCLGRHQPDRGQPRDELFAANRLRQSGHRFGQFPVGTVRVRDDGSRLAEGLLFKLGQIDPTRDVGKPLLQLCPLNRPVKPRAGQAFGGQQFGQDLVATPQFRPLVEVVLDQRPLTGPPAVLLVDLDQGQQHAPPTGIRRGGQEVRNRRVTLRLPRRFESLDDRTVRGPSGVVQFGHTLGQAISHRGLPNAAKI